MGGPPPVDPAHTPTEQILYYIYVIYPTELMGVEPNPTHATVPHLNSFKMRQPNITSNTTNVLTSNMPIQIAPLFK